MRIPLLYVVLSGCVAISAEDRARRVGGIVDLDVGEHGVCFVNTDQEMDCYGSMPTDDSGAFVQVAVASSGMCGIDTDKRVTCWNDSTADTQWSHGSDAVQLACDGDSYSYDQATCCALDDQGDGWCWNPLDGDDFQLPGGNYTDLEVTKDEVFVLGSDGVATVFPFSSSGVSEASSMSLEGTFSEVALWPGSACAITAQDGAVVCDDDDREVPSGDGLHALAMSRTGMCALDANGEAHCTVDIEGDESAIDFKTLAAAREQYCGITALDSVYCFATGD
jgi:hypothetical protein